MKSEKGFAVFISSLFIGTFLLISLSGIGEDDSKVTTRTIFEVVEQCTDGIQNYDETGVDCGGSCADCSVGGGAPTGGSGGGGGGGGGFTPIVTTPSINETKSIEVSTPGLTTVIKDFDIETRIKKIQIEVKTEVQDLSITVSKYDGRPENVTEISGRVYRYLKIDAENLGDNLEKATITFQVDESWVFDNGLEKEDIILFKFNESYREWNELDTNYDSSDEVYHYYEVELDSFSYFAIGEKIRLVGDITEGGISLWIWILTIVIIIFIVGIIIIFSKRKKALKENIPT